MTEFRDAAGFPLLATAGEVREMDRRTIAELGVPGRVLMELAGAGTAQHVAVRLGERPGRVVVLCGAGNNGGDGYVIARHLADRGHAVVCLATTPAGALTGDARANAELWASLGGEVRAVDAVDASVVDLLARADAVVDALFGTGLTRAIAGLAAELLAAANACERPLRVAVDVPSGVDASTGRVLGPAFAADLTTTYGLAKAGLFTAPGAACAGEVVVVPIGLPRQVVDTVGASLRRAEAGAIARLLPARPAEGHKGTFGHVGVLGGFGGKAGAAQLAARAALRVGAGLVTWTSPGEAPPRAPEIMHQDLRQGLPERPDVWVVGPGLGTDETAQRAVEQAYAAGKRLVVDADALNLVASLGTGERLAGHVITPHPREASRLLGVTVDAVEADRAAALGALVTATGATVVLKGARTLVGGPQEPPVLFDRPTPALAAGGSGDVLAGAIAGLMAQGASPRDAACAAVWIHADAGRAAGQGRAERGVLASELADALPAAIDALVQGWS